MIYDSKIARLKFNLGTLIDIKANTGKDPLNTLTDNMDTVDMVLFVKAVFEAGCRSESGTVTEGFNDLSFTDLADILNAFTKAYSVQGEVNEDTQQGQAAVS